MRANTGPRVALKVELQRDNVVKPVGRQVQDLTRLQDDFIALGLLEQGKLFQIGVAPVNGRVSRRRVTLFVKVQIFALVGMRQYIPPTATQNDDTIAGSVKVILSNHSLHSKSTVNALLLLWFDNIQRLFWLKEWQFIVQVLAGAAITAAIISHESASNQSIIPVWIVRSQLVVCNIGMLEPFVVGNAQQLGGFLPVFGDLFGLAACLGHRNKVHKVIVFAAKVEE